MKNKKAFTLIELLAVIVILGVIMLIAIPMVTNYIAYSKKNALINSTEGIVSSVINEINAKELSESNIEGTYTILNNKIVEANKFSYTGKLPDAGVFTISADGEIEIAAHDNNWCVTKRYDDNTYNINPYTDGVCEVPEVESCFTFDKATKTITAYSDSCPRDVTIPNTISGLEVKIIGESAFDSKGINSVVIPNSVDEIKDQAFYNNNLTQILIPSGVTSINGSSFSYNNITEVTLPSSITSIGGYAFYDNELSEIIIPDKVTDIGIGAFRSNKLTTISIGTNVNSMGTGVFADNQMVGANAWIYNRNSDKSINTTSLNSYAGTSDTPVIPSNVVTIGNDAFNASGITSITIPSGVTTIGKYAFFSNRLTSVTIPNTVTLVDRSAFFKADYSNPGLATIIYPGATIQDWGYAINNSSNYKFTTGTVINTYGNVIIKSS